MPKHIFITGASSGIGEAIARIFDKKDHVITIVARRKPLLEKLKSELKAMTLCLVADLSQPEQAFQALKTAQDQNGPIDVLINNAGVAFVAHTAQVPEKEINQVFQINLLTPILLIQKVLPGMLQRKQGIIINICSTAAITPLPYFSHYNGTKAGFAAYSESLRPELDKQGIQVLTVYPGPIKTDMADRNIASLEKTFFRDRVPTGTAEKLARLIDEALNKKLPRIIYPKIYFFTRYFAPLSQWFIEKTTPKAL